MFNYKKNFILLLLLVGAFVLSGCSDSYFVNSRIDDVLKQNSSSQDAQDWLVYNQELVAPVLTDRLSSGNKNRVEETKELLNIMGEDGITIVLSDFASLNDSGKIALAEVLSSQNTKPAVLQLLAMSSLEGGFDISVTALVGMGDTAIEFLETLLYQDKYYSCVNSVLAGNSDKVITDIIPLVNDENSYIQNRALEILALSDSQVVAPLVTQVLSDTSMTNDKARRISAIALANNRETAIDEIINTVALGNTDPVASATMLYELSKDDDLGIIFEKCARSSNAINTSDMLKEMVTQAGVPRIIETALNSQSTETITSISFALATYAHSKETFVEILNAVTDTDTANSQIYQLADKLIYDPILSDIAKSIIAIDADALNAALQSEGASPKSVGESLSETSQNSTIVNRLDNMLSNMDSSSLRSSLIMLVYGEDDVYPSLVWDRYKSTDANLSQSAMDVILEATSVGIKFQYTDMDFTPYAQKLLQDLNSSNKDIQNTAALILNKIPEGVEHHDFYQQIYAGYKDPSIFSILCWHHVGEGAKKLNLKIEGTENVLTEMSYDIKSIKVTNVSTRHFIDYEGMIKQSFNALGLKIVDSANTELVISINEVPLSKHYYGLVGQSYLGAKCTTTIEVYQNNQKIKTVTGYYEILPPKSSPVGTDYSEYKPDPEDAPMEIPFIYSYIGALYNTFGEDVLFGTYQFDRLATLEIGQEIWE